MELVGEVRDTFEKAEAGTIVQMLLEQQVKAGLLGVDPAMLSTVLVHSVWEARPKVFNGGFGQRPHKLSIAAAALAKGVAVANEEHCRSTRDAYTAALGTLFATLETNVGLYAWNPLDHALLESASRVVADLTIDHHGVDI